MLPRAVTRSCRPRFSPTSLVFYVTRQHGQAISTRRRLERQYSASSSTASPSSSNVASASTSDKSTTKTKTKVKESDDLPPLSRPLGVPELPTTYKKTWRDRTLELMDQDVRMERRKHLVKEATRGYYADLHAVRKHGGKTWIAPKTLIREDHALYFPNISGSPLDGSSKEVHTAELCEGKVSVVAILSSVMSEEHVRSFLSDFPTHPSFQLLHINLQQNPLHSLLLSLSLSSLRRKVEKHLHPTYLLSSTNMEYLREPMGMDNKHIGYVYLLDGNQKVRWVGGGMGTNEERESLRACVEVLLGRLDKKGGGDEGGT